MPPQTGLIVWSVVMSRILIQCTEKRLLFHFKQKHISKSFLIPDAGSSKRGAKVLPLGV
jgi:hypothetical protein